MREYLRGASASRRHPDAGRLRSPENRSLCCQSATRASVPSRGGARPLSPETRGTLAAATRRAPIACAPPPMATNAPPWFATGHPLTPALPIACGSSRARKNFSRPNPRRWTAAITGAHATPHLRKQLNSKQDWSVSALRRGVRFRPGPAPGCAANFPEKPAWHRPYKGNGV